MNELIAKMFTTGLWLLVPSAISVIIGEYMRQCLWRNRASNGWFIAAAVFFAPIVVALCIYATTNICTTWGMTWQ